MAHADCNPITRRLAALALLAASTVLAAGCSQELASYDDVYVPASIEENYPIKVVQQPVKLTVDVPAGKLGPQDVGEVKGFARQAAQTARSPVTISYPSGSKRAQQAASEVAGLIAAQGVPRNRINLARYDGHAPAVTMSFTGRSVVTKPCGDFSENLRPSQFNTPPVNFGCAFQQNLAAMVTDKDDLVRPRPMTPALSAGQNPALKKYMDGTWTVPVVAPTTTGTSSN